jgi:hypothetical protein
LAERILALGEMARKKETEREKVQPFLVLSEESDMMEKEVAQAGEVDPGSITDQKHPLANFHKKFNRVFLKKRQDGERYIAEIYVFLMNILICVCV